MARELGAALLGLGSEAGLPPIDGIDPNVLSFPAFAADEALTIRPANTGGEIIASWAIGLDVYIPQPSGTFVSLLQTGDGDGDLFLRDNGDGTAGIGISGVYDGAVPFDAWTRIVATFTVENGSLVLRKFVDGTLVGTQDLGATSRWTVNPATGLKLFTDNDGETGAGAVSAVFFSSEVPSAGEVEALVASIPTPTAAGFFPAAPSSGAIEINFENENVIPRYGFADVVLEGFGFGTSVAIGDSVVGFPSQLGIEAPGDDDVPVLVTPGFAPDEALTATIPLEADDLTTYTAVWDVRLEALPDGFLALLQTDPTNASDGDLFVRSDGALGIGGVYDGSVPTGTFTRIAITVEDQGDGTAILSKYIDGALVGTQSVDAARFTIQSNEALLLLADNDGETGPAAIAHFGILPRALSADEVMELGGVDADGPFERTDPGGSDGEPQVLPVRLTEDEGNASGAVFTKEAVATDGLTFESQFSFRIVTESGAGADGITFQIQTERPGEPLLGPTAGGFLGLPVGPFPGITVAFDTWQNTETGFEDVAPNQIRLFLGDDADSTPAAVADSPVVLGSGDTYRAWVEYDGAALTVFISATDEKPVTPVLDAAVDLSSVLGETAKFGFSGATGGSSSIHDVLSWELTTNAGEGPTGQLLSEDQSAVDLFGDASRLAPIDFDPQAPLQLGFDDLDATVEFGFSAAEVIDEPTVANPINDLLLDQTGEGTTISLPEVFGSDATNFAVTTSNGDTVEAEIVDGELILTPGALGHADIVVSALAANGATLEEEFRAIVAGPNAYVFAIIPDTQDYTSNAAIRETFGNMTDWLVDQKESLSIQHAIHVGDIVQFGAVSQWQIAEEAMERLDGILSYSLAVGNHDQERPGTGSAFAFETDIDVYFTPEQVGATPELGGGTYDGFDVGTDFFGNGNTYDDSIRNAYTTLTTPDGTNWLVLSLEFGMPDDVLRWAGEVIEDHLDHRVIINTHSWNGGDGRVTPTTEPLNTDNGGWGYNIRNNPRNVNDGEDAWRELASKYPNVLFTFNGHNFMGGAETVVSYAAGDNPVYQIFVNYQNGAWAGVPDVGTNGGNGALRLIVMDPDNDRVTTHTKLVELDTYYEAFPDHQETFENVDFGTPELIAIAKAGFDMVVVGDGVTATVSLEGSAVGNTEGATYAWINDDGETLGETDGAPLEVTLPTGVNRLTLQVTDVDGNVSTDEKTVIVEAPDALLTDTFDDGDLAGWTGPVIEEESVFSLGTDVGFAQPAIDPGAAQITLTITFDSHWRPFDAQTGTVALSFDGGAPVEVLRYDGTTTNDTDQRNETVTINALVPTSVSDVAILWRYDDADNDWYWAIDNVEVTVGGFETVTEIWSEDFDDLVDDLDPAVDENIPATVLGWTRTLPDGFGADATLTVDPDTPPGTTEWRGWTFTTPEFWVAADVQARDEFTRGTGVIAVADGDEWDDFNGGSEAPDDLSTAFTTGSIDVTSATADGAATLRLTFDSHWRPFDNQTGVVSVSVDGGPSEELLRLDSTSTTDTDSRNTGYVLDFTAEAGAETVAFTFEYLDADNDWYWAIDNLALSEVEQAVLLSEDFDGLADDLQPAVDENTSLLGWTHVGPEGWSRTVDPDSPQGTTEWRGWSFVTPAFWVAADVQARDEFTKGSGVIAVADGDEWDDFNGGAGGDTDSLDTTIGTPALDLVPFGGGQEPGEEAGVVRVDALSGEEAILVTPGATGTLTDYTIIFDILASETSATFSALFQTDVTNSGDAEIYLRNDGASASIGISGDYDGALTYGAWGRIALVFETDEAGVQTLSKYLDGVFLDSQVVDGDLTDGSRWTIDADAGFLLFSEPNGFTSEIYANAVHFTPEALAAEEIEALGGVDVDGPIDAPANADAFQLNFDGALDGLDYGAATVEAIDLSTGPDTTYQVKGSLFGNPDGVGEAALYAQANGANELIYWADGADWTNYVFDVEVEPADNDTIGVVFYFQDENNHYELTLNQQDDVRTLTKVEDGVATVLATETASYAHFSTQLLRVAIVDGTITVTLDEDLLFDGPVTDSDPLSGGTVGILSRFMNRVEYDNVSVNPVELTARILGEAPQERWAADLDGDGVATVNLTAQASLTKDGIDAYEWIVDGEVVATGETAALDLAPGETTVTLRVTDTDGTVAEDAKTVTVAAKSDVLLSDDFEDGDFDGWTIVDEGTINGPSDWSVADGALTQATDIRSTQLSTGSTAFSEGGDGPFILRDGTYALWSEDAALDWTDYAVEAEITPGDNEGVGLLFRYTDAENYYKLEADAQTGLIMLTRHEDGYETILARGWHEYTPGEAQHWRVEAEGGVLTAYIDGIEIFGTEVDDRALESGTVGLYGWGSEDLAFDDVVVTALASEEGDPLDGAEVQATTGGRDRLEGTDGVLDGFVIGIEGAGFFSKDQITGFEAGDLIDLRAFGFEDVAQGRDFPLADGVLQVIDYGAFTGLFGSAEAGDVSLRVGGDVEDVLSGLLI